MISLRSLAEGQVYDRNGAPIGRLADLAIHRFSGQILYARLAVSARRARPAMEECLVRWNMLRSRPDGGFDLTIDLDAETVGSEAPARPAPASPRPAPRPGLTAGYGRA